MAILRKLIIMDKIKEVDYSLYLIMENMPKDSKEFNNMGLLKDGIMKRLELIIQNIIDICAIISSDLRLEKPDSEEKIIDNLGKAGILNNEMVNKIKEMKGLRNILVHRYGKINDELIFENINKDLDDINNFINEIDLFINNK